jgi:predicted dehydrogenase
MKKLHQIPEENTFKDWKELAQREKFADAVIIATQDQMHIEPAIAFANLKYNILLEKPIAITKEGCQQVIDAILKNKVIFSTGHVLRYTPMTQTVKKIIKEKLLGDILNVQHLEPVEAVHYSHSYVRGNWNNTQKATFMLLAKSCHDIDWIHYILGEKCTKISSFGSLKHFNSKNKPKEASSRCLDCKVESQCPYSAKKIYLESVKQGKTGWPTDVIIENGDIPDIENVTESLKTTDYGRCVYDSDNNVVDNQVVIMEFESQATATFSMISTTKKQHRQTRIFGSLGQLEIDDADIKWTNFLTKETIQVEYENNIPKDTKMRGIKSFC